MVREQCRPAGISGNIFSPCFVAEYRGSAWNPCSFPRRVAPLAARRAFAPPPAGANLGSSSHESHRVLRPDPGGGAVRGREHESPRTHPAGCHALQEGHRQGKSPAARRCLPGSSARPGRTQHGAKLGAEAQRSLVGKRGQPSAACRRLLHAVFALESSGVRWFLCTSCCFREGGEKKKKKGAAQLRLLCCESPPKTSPLWIRGNLCGQHALGRLERSCADARLRPPAQISRLPR